MSHRGAEILFVGLLPLSEIDPMTFQPLQSQPQVREAFGLIMNALTRGAQRYDRTLGYQGGNLLRAVFWHESMRFWACFDWDDEHPTEFLCLYGTQDPTNRRSLDITVQTDSYRSGCSRRTAGAFLRDTEGKIFLAHSGRIAGGRKGIGKSAFTNLYRGGRWVAVSWLDGVKNEMLLIGCLADERFPKQMATFVHEVERLKLIALTQAPSDPLRPVGDSFRPEFEGARISYEVEHEVSGWCDHGIVVNELARQLEARNYRVGNDRFRDLFTIGSKGSIDILFEVKSGVLLYDLYTGVGQLMLLGAVQTKPPRRVLVIPSMPNDRTRLRLESIGIEVLVYNWDDEEPEFPDLSQVLRGRRTGMRG